MDPLVTSLLIPATGAQEISPSLSMSMSMSPIDTQLALSTFIGIAGYCAINKLFSDAPNSIYSTVLSYIPPVVIFVNQIWKQSLASQLSINNRLLQIAVSPWTFLATYTLTKISDCAFFEWPTAIATAYVIGLNSFHKGAVALRDHRYAALSLHLFAGIGSTLQTLAFLRILPINRNSAEGTTGGDIGSPSWFAKLRAKWAENDVRREKEDAKRDAKYAKRDARRQAKLKIKLENIDQDEKKEIIAALRMKKRFDNNLHRTVECLEPDPKIFQGMSYLDRATHPDLNPVCPEHAKIILAPMDGNAQSIKENDCVSVARMAKLAMVKTHPDVNSKNMSVATRAFKAVAQALETLCPKVSEEEIYKIKEYFMKKSWNITSAFTSYHF